MQLKSSDLSESTAAGAGVPDAATLGSRLAALEEALREVSRGCRAAEEEYWALVGGADGDAKKTAESVKKRLAAEVEAAQTGFAEAEERIAERRRRHNSMVERAHSACRARVDRDLQKQVDRCERERRRAKDGIVARHQKQVGPASDRHAAFLEDVAELRSRAGALAADAEGLAGEHGVLLKPVEGAPGVEGLNDSSQPEEAVALVAALLEGAGDEAEVIRAAFWPSLARRFRFLVVLALVVLAHTAAVVLCVKLGLGLMWVLAAFGSLLLLGGLLATVSSTMRHNVGRCAGRMSQTAADASALLARWEPLGRERLDPEQFMEARIASTLEVEEGVNARIDELQLAADQKLKRLEEKYLRLKERVKSGHERGLAELRRARAASEEHLARAARDGIEGREAEQRENRRQAGARREARLAELRARWDRHLAEAVQLGRELTATSRARHPEWDSPHWDGWRPPTGFPADVPVGEVDLDLADLAADCGRPEGFGLPAARKMTLPVSLSFPGCGSLLLEAGPGERDLALDVLRNTVLRALASLPPGKAKLTVMDPVGLGQSFSALMQLADHDESLVSGRIWTEASHIERRLAELTEHIEKVIQKYLRNRYATIDDYNREAGEIKEAYHFLVVADFPTGFSDLGLERLASIVNSGARCGVYTLIYRDSRQPLPAQLDAESLKRCGPVITAGAGSLTVQQGGLRRGAFRPELPPPGEQVSRLLGEIGRLAEAGKRVEVPFGSAAPAPEEVWSASAEAGLRVPVGRSGADRLQYLDLGRGTAQHALVGGRTGSGKSTLFHVMITNTALWFSPREVEFYLIDFKKGVEFKTFAANRLPHARVIAIESDREFGLSVLQRINRELARRGELFRAAGVQDLAAYRKSGGGEHLPRTLLLIDEFQEFFTEDDAIARDAALLLDRFVRQGRAFGIHVVLGSQTLSGVYALAKSTMGQMGVRIALQCNESDSHLILSEDNGAARLLARPGEAIYNDTSGLLEGNSPFQVVWLPDDVEEGYLKSIAGRAESEGWSPVEPAVVFEGNAPAELAANAELAALLGRAHRPEDVAERVWLGEANSIKGPTEVTFPAAGGGNLLLVGQHREAAFAGICSSIISLAASHAPGEVRMIVFSAGGREDECTLALEKLAGALPHGLEVVGPGKIPEVVEGLEAEVTSRRESGAREGAPAYVFVFGAQRFRLLRQDEDYLFSSSREEAKPTGERFADLLREGPEAGVHSIVWGDSLANLQRTFARKTMREFDARVLFQMSAADSSELVDQTAANNLGLHNALLFVDSTGALEKFRPYTVPSAAYIAKLADALKAKFRS
ncbi:MAG: FtsK/SpoIIIE domain-containing protein [Planctomycetota bacterium]|jgi:hypothetical protein